MSSQFSPAGDQPQAIDQLTGGLRAGARDQVLLGVTGSGKTFTMANIISALAWPTLILAPNKTLAAQLFGEMKQFFPDNAVEYFVSYYDYYQPEAYIARTDTYIAKEATINQRIDRLRHSATRSLLERRDAIVVASVSCIYSIGSVETYSEMTFKLVRGQQVEREQVLSLLTELQYRRNDLALERGNFRVRGDTLELFPAHLEDRAWKVSWFGQQVDGIYEIDAINSRRIAELDEITVYPNSHYVTPKPTLNQAIIHIEQDLELRLSELTKQGKLLEAQRLEQRTRFDLELLTATGMCSGIENYARYLNGSKPGQPPPTLFSYLPEQALLFVDESHVAVPQLTAMYRGDAARKSVLVEHGFRLPSCTDNRPLKFEEWEVMRPATIFVSATPGTWEVQRANGIMVEQLVRPTGLVDPAVVVRDVEYQVDDLVRESCEVTRRSGRVLVTTLTKKMAEHLTEYLHEAGLRVRYLHSDVETLERTEIIRDLRLGVFDVLVGINLLREGLDIPECALVAIMDADSEGYLRSCRALIQTIGRAARNLEGRAILYADRVTDSMRLAIEETDRRRRKQQLYNATYGIVPTSIRKGVNDVLEGYNDQLSDEAQSVPQRSAVALAEPTPRPAAISAIKKKMKRLAEELRFEEAAQLRDRLRELEAGRGSMSAIPGPETGQLPRPPKAVKAGKRVTTSTRKRRKLHGWLQA